jgi:hypothetical protein
MDRLSRLYAMEERLLKRLNDRTGPPPEALERLLAEVRRKRRIEERMQWAGDSMQEWEA